MGGNKCPSDVFVGNETRILPDTSAARPRDCALTQFWPKKISCCSLPGSETCSPSQQWENTFNLIPFLFLVFSKACSQLMNVFVTNPQQSYCTQAKRYESQETQAECYLDFEIEDNLVGQLIIALADRERVLQEKLSNISATWSRVDFFLEIYHNHHTDCNPNRENFEEAKQKMK